MRKRFVVRDAQIHDLVAFGAESLRFIARQPKGMPFVRANEVEALNVAVANCLTSFHVFLDA